MPYTGATPDAYGALEKARGLRERTWENSARQAEAWGFQSTLGIGETRFPDVIDFQLTFVEEPAVGYGYSVNAVVNNSDGGDLLVTTRFPRAWGGVYDWRQDTNGFYTGAWVFAIVQSQDYFLGTAQPEPNYTLRHSYSFSGIAYKALPDRLGFDL